LLAWSVDPRSDAAEEAASGPRKGRTLTVRRMRTLVAIVTAVAMSGCATLRENHPLCVALFTATGAAALGAVGGAVMANNGDTGDEINGEIAAATAGGVVAGGLLGWGLSNWFCEEPPPPPVHMAPPPPPPPPPPPTERRGG
jgi:hypothetical protein